MNFDLIIINTILLYLEKKISINIIVFNILFNSYQ